MAAFQSFIGLANLGAAQTKAPPLMLGSETVDGLTISTSKFQPEIEPPKGTSRWTAATTSRRRPCRWMTDFVISSSLGLARDLVPKTLREPAAHHSTSCSSGPRGRRPWRARCWTGIALSSSCRTCSDKGNAREAAEGEVNLLLELLRYLGRGTLTASDRDDAVVLKAEFRPRLDSK